MLTDKSETSPQVYARIGGLAYLIIIIAGAFDELFIRNRIIVSGDALATAHNITTHPLLWRIGICGDLTMHVCDLIVAMVYYFLFKRVNKNLALLSLLFGLLQTAVLVANKINLVMPLFLLENGDYLKVFDPHQLQALSYLFIKAHGYGFGIGLIFFGCACIIDAYLIFKSGFLPKLLGVLLLIAGLCYLINSFLLILFPTLSNSIFPVILTPPFIAELSISGWLLFKGVNIAKWKAWTV
jgi:Domain of unknown function (DUF4386)